MWERIRDAGTNAVGVALAIFVALLVLIPLCDQRPGTPPWDERDPAVEYDDYPRP